MDKVKTVCLFAGMEWHEWEEKYISEQCFIIGHQYPPREKYVCKMTGQIIYNTDNKMPSPNLDPLNNKGDYWSFVEKMMKHEGWEDFYRYVFKTSHVSSTIKASAPSFIPWLLLDPARFVTLVYDWLGQEEVQERWGWVECKSYTGDCPCGHSNTECIGIGKVKAPWLEEMEASRD